MRNNLVLAAIGLSSLASPVNGCSEISGNMYCNAVQAIQYSNVGAPGTYNQVTDMPSDGNCTSTPRSFSGPISPLDEEVSVHFRGPLQLKQFAAYVPGSTTNEKREALGGHRRREHHHLKKHIKGAKARHDERDKIYATIDGQLVSWDNNMAGYNAQPSVDPATQIVTATIDGIVQTWVNNWFGFPSVAKSEPTSVAESEPTAAVQATVVTADNTVISTLSMSATSQIPPSTTSTAVSTASGSYGRIGYYNSVDQTLDNLVFLANFGGQSSGVWDSAYGNSLAFSNSQGTGGAASPQILADTTLPSDAEVIIMLDEKCDSGSCGYVRPGTVAYHGFDGADKIFLIEFGMPNDEREGFNGDMPAIWLLNAQIPRTLQYGNADCSCWESGCGEFDIAETLSSGSSFLKSTIHTNRPGGDSNYFARPTSGTMKLAVVFNSKLSTIHLQTLPSDADFPTSLTTDAINDICDLSSGNELSNFVIS